MNRRDLLKGLISGTAAGIVLPGDEVVRRFWRGWAPKAAAQESPIFFIGESCLVDEFPLPTIQVISTSSGYRLDEHGFFVPHFLLRYVRGDELGSIYEYAKPLVNGEASISFNDLMGEPPPDLGSFQSKVIISDDRNLARDWVEDESSLIQGWTVR